MLDKATLIELERAADRVSRLSDWAQCGPITATEWDKLESAMLAVSRIYAAMLAVKA